MIAEHLFQCLSENTAVQPLVGVRIFPNLAPQGEKRSHIAYQQVSYPREYMSDGDPRTRRTVRYDLRCFGPEGITNKNYIKAHEVAKAASRALEMVNSQTRSDGTVLLSATIENEIDNYDDKVQQHFVVVSAELHYCEPN